MGDEREGRRRSLMGAGPLLGQLHFLPSVEAEQTHGTQMLVLLASSWCTHAVNSSVCSFRNTNTM